MNELFITVAVLVFGFIAYKAGEMKGASKGKGTSNGGITVSLDETGPDTSKEDAIKDKYGL